MSVWGFSAHLWEPVERTLTRSYRLVSAHLWEPVERTLTRSYRLSIAHSTRISPTSAPALNPPALNSHITLYIIFIHPLLCSIHTQKHRILSQLGPKNLTKCWIAIGKLHILCTLVSPHVELLLLWFWSCSLAPMCPYKCQYLPSSQLLYIKYNKAHKCAKT